MRRAWALLAIAIAATIIGCDGFGRRVFSARFPAIDGDPDGKVDVAALPVRLHDSTGMVTGLELVDGLRDDLMADLIEGRVNAVPGRPEALRVAWVGGACEQDVALVLSADRDGFDLSITANRGLTFFSGCPSVGIGRAVVIGFDRPIDPIDVVVTVEMG